MTIFNDRQQRRRRVGKSFWKRMRNPKVLVTIIKIGYALYRLVRFIIEFFGLGG